MKALVTGATGFVGSHLVETLVRRGAEVTALVRSPARASLLNLLGVRQIPGDLHSPDALREATRGQDVVFHVAGLVAARDEAGFFHGNRAGTLHLVEAVLSEAGSRTRLVLVSSMAAGGPAGLGKPRLGGEPSMPVTAYGRSKLAAEEVVRGSGLPWTIVRPPMVYGPRDTEVLKLFRIARLGVVPLFGDGSQELSAVYGADLAEALVAAAGEEAVGKTYYACHPEVVTSRDFVRAVRAALAAGRGGVTATEALVLPLPRWVATAALTATAVVARISGRPTILTPDKANEFFQPAWTGDPSPLMLDTGWRPGHDLSRGLARTAAWYREHGWL